MFWQLEVWPSFASIHLSPSPSWLSPVFLLSESVASEVKDDPTRPQTAAPRLFIQNFFFFIPPERALPETAGSPWTESDCSTKLNCTLELPARPLASYISVTLKQRRRAANGLKRMKILWLGFQMNGRHSAIARPLRGKEFDPTNCRNYMLMVQNHQPKRDPNRSALLWLLKRVILGENVKGVEIRLHSWREEERESATLFQPQQMEWSDTGGKESGVLILFFSLLFACFFDFGGFEMCNQVLVLPRNMECRLKRRCSVWEEKNKHRHSRPTSTTTLMNRLTFFFSWTSITPTPLYRAEGFAVVHTLYSVIAVAPWPCGSPFDREVRKRCVFSMKECIGCPATWRQGVNSI